MEFRYLAPRRAWRRSRNRPHWRRKVQLCRPQPPDLVSHGWFLELHQHTPTVTPFAGSCLLSIRPCQKDPRSSGHGQGTCDGGRCCGIAKRENSARLFLPLRSSRQVLVVCPVDPDSWMLGWGTEPRSVLGKPCRAHLNPGICFSAVRVWKESMRSATSPHLKVVAGAEFPSATNTPRFSHA